MPCPCCGHALDGAACRHCHGHARTLDGGRALPPAAGWPLAAAWRGFAAVRAAAAAMLHGEEFVGRLRVPVAANACAFVLVVGGGGALLAPLCSQAFAGSWGWFDGWRAATAGRGPALWLLTTWLLLGPPLLDALAGGFQEPLRLATEQRLLGNARAAPPRPALRRLRDRARVLALAVVLLPPALLLALVPWIGLPLVLALGAASAAVVWFEPPMAARGLDLRQRVRLLWRNRWPAFGTGMGLQLAAAVPFVNVLGLAPIAIIAATASYLSFDKHRN